MPSVFLIDDHPMIRMGYRALLEREPDLTVAGEAADAEAALAAIREQRPDLAIVDISLGEGPGGLRLVEQIRQQCPETARLVVSMHDEALYAERALRAGAQGYVMKSTRGEELLEAVRTVLEGQVYVSPGVRDRVLRSLLGAEQAIISALERLSDREIEVFEYLGHGRSTREIADALDLSIKTVDTYRHRIKEKLGLKTTSELVQQAVLWVQANRNT